jgi:hypothetical protein
MEVPSLAAEKRFIPAQRIRAMHVIAEVGGTAFPGFISSVFITGSKGGGGIGSAGKDSILDFFLLI